MRSEFLAIALLGGCVPHDTIPGGPGHPASVGKVTARPPVDPAEQAAFERARPVFERHCAPCHTSAGARASREKLAHFDMDAYPFAGHHAAEAGAKVREVLGAAGAPATMPADHPGAVQGEELELVLAWSRAFDAAHGEPAQQHEHGGHH